MQIECSLSAFWETRFFSESKGFEYHWLPHRKCLNVNNAFLLGISLMCCTLFKVEFIIYYKYTMSLIIFICYYIFDLKKSAYLQSGSKVLWHFVNAKNLKIPIRSKTFFSVRKPFMWGINPKVHRPIQLTGELRNYNIVWT